MVKLGKRPELDGVRGLAILSVVVYHYAAGGWIPGGFLGVDLFFVLSGFLITTILVNEWDATGAISFRGFYRRRALRLFPALATLLVFGAVLAFVGSGSERVAAATFVLVTAGYVANIAVMIGLPVYSAFTWSLAAEEQFYLLWPALLIRALRGGVDRHRLATRLLAAAALSWVLAAQFELVGGHAVALYSPVTRASAILCGCAAGVLYASGRLPRVSPALGLGGLAAYLAVIFSVSFNSHLSVLVGLPAAAIGGTLLVCSTLEPSRWLCWLAWRPLAYLGTISYAMYLWNIVIFDNLHGLPRVLGIPITIAVAAVSMRLIERPFLALKAKRTAQPSTLQPSVAPARAVPANG